MLRTKEFLKLFIREFYRNNRQNINDGIMICNEKVFCINATLPLVDTVYVTQKVKRDQVQNTVIRFLWFFSSEKLQEHPINTHKIPA